MNVVTLVAHDIGRFLPCYGVKTAHTPHLDRLAAEGVVFEKAFCTAPQCCPARATLFTGLDNHRTGMIGLVGKAYGWQFQPERPHLAARLKTHGYHTGAFGIIHEIGNTGRDPAELFLKQGFDHLSPWEGGEQRFGTRVAENFGDWLDTHDKTQTGQPFYAQLGVFETHLKFDFVPCQPDDSLGVTIPPPLCDGPATREYFAKMQDYVKYLDAAVGKILETLDRTGHAEDTLIMFTSDHGLEIPRGKGTLYDLGLETAYLMRGPGLPAGTRYPHLHSHADYVPTILEAVGLEPDPALNGISHWQALQNASSSPSPREAHFSAKTMHSQYDPMRAIRTDRWKYIRNFEHYVPEQCCTDVNHGPLFEEQVPILRLVPNPTEELYDLETDPGELTNLAKDATHEKMRADLERKLARHLVDNRDPILDGPIGTPAYLANRNQFLQAAGTASE